MTAPLPSPEDRRTAGVRVEHGMAVIRIPLGEVHAFRVALAECPCRATKSTGTASIRTRLAQALGRLGV